MEKKTIGKFIAVLRKANGMTQKDLADKLFVSDKTVSRWERDECDPDLSLIPAIAELFGITTDELLRGERNSPEAPVAEEIKPSTKSEKQFKTLTSPMNIDGYDLKPIDAYILKNGETDRQGNVFERKPLHFSKVRTQKFNTYKRRL